MSRLTLNGFYNYDNTLFDNVVLPDGINKEYVINEIMKRGDLYTYHQALGPLKRNIEDWFSRRFFDFSMILNALRGEYSPLENYDRKENISRSHAKNGSDTTTGTNEATTGSTLSHSETVSDSAADTNKSSAFNAADFVDVSKTESIKNAGINSNDSTASNASSETSATTVYGSGFTESEENRIHGNIGITTNQAMAREELELRARYDLYTVIADQFEREFLIQVY